MQAEVERLANGLFAGRARELAPAAGDSHTQERAKSVLLRVEEAQRLFLLEHRDDVAAYFDNSVEKLRAWEASPALEHFYVHTGLAKYMIENELWEAEGFMQSLRDANVTGPRVQEIEKIIQDNGFQ